MTNEIEVAVRREPICRGCGHEKSMGGLVVCWGCFKYRQDEPFKYFDGDLDQWLVAIGRGQYTTTNTPPLMPAEVY